MHLRTKAFIAAAFLVGTLIVVAYPFVIGGGPAYYGAGGAAGKLLRGGFYPWLTIEIDAEVELPEEDVARVVDFIDRYTDKSFIHVTQSIIDVKPDFGSQFSPSGLRKLNAEHRNTAEFSFMAMSIHLLVIDGFYTENAIGVTYGTTSIAVFISSAPTMAYIAPIIAHEIGHLFGLNCLTELEPPTGVDWFCDNGHSTNAESLMAPGIFLASKWVTAMELMPSEVDQLAYIKANQ